MASMADELKITGKKVDIFFMNKTVMKKQKVKRVNEHVVVLDNDKNTRLMLHNVKKIEDSE